MKAKPQKPSPFIDSLVEETFEKISKEAGGGKRETVELLRVYNEKLNNKAVSTGRKFISFFLAVALVVFPILMAGFYIGWLVSGGGQQ